MNHARHIAAIQLDCTIGFEKTQKNLSESIATCASQGAQLVVLPELHTHPYFCQTADCANFTRAETIPGETTQYLSALAQHHHLVIVATIFEQRAPGVYHNTAVVIERDGTIAGLYRKMHIPDDPGYHEKYYFTPGDQGFVPINCSIGRLGVLICWDQWFPEAARLMALAGADCLIYPTAIGWDKQETVDEHSIQFDAWLTIQKSHAIANALPVITCNRVGFEAKPGTVGAGQQFWGGSFICDGRGQIMTQACHRQATVIHAKLDSAETASIRQHWPFLRDRRIDAYSKLSARYL